MNNVIIWKYGEPMEKSYKRTSVNYAGSDKVLNHTEGSRIPTVIDSYKNRDTINNYNNEFGCLVSNPFFAGKSISDVISNQDEFLRGRPNNMRYNI